eukprot:scaffold85325_cov30-Tisochrysis_lutea.AAC.3
MSHASKRCRHGSVLRVKCFPSTQWSRPRHLLPERCPCTHLRLLRLGRSPWAANTGLPHRCDAALPRRSLLGLLRWAKGIELPLDKASAIQKAIAQQLLSGNTERP